MLLMTELLINQVSVGSCPSGMLGTAECGELCGFTHVVCVLLPQISRSLAPLTDESQDSEKEKVAKEIIQIRTMAEDIATTVTQLQSEDSPVIGEHLLNVVDSLEDQLAGNDTHRALCLESPPSVTPEHQASLAPVNKPNLPRRRDSKRRYLRYSASVKRSSTASQDGGECSGRGGACCVTCVRDRL